MKDKRSTDAIDAALRYAAGEISREELNEYARAAADASCAYYAAYDASYAADAASYARAAYAAASAYAYAAASAYRAAASYYASYASYAARSASYAAAYRAAEAANQLDTAAICREVLTEAVIEKVKQLSQ
jgi:hypothetical protein